MFLDSWMKLNRSPFQNVHADITVVLGEAVEGRYLAIHEDKINNNFGLSRKILRERHFFFVNTQQSGFYISSYFNTPQYQPQASDEPLTCNGFLSV